MTEYASDDHHDEADGMATADERLVGRSQTLHIGRDRPIRISTGHRILHHDGKCARPHGHNYEVAVTIEGTLTEEGWIADKGDITAVIDEWDHRFLLQRGDPLVEAFEAAGDADGIVVLDQPPTAEVMSVLLEDKLRAELGENVTDVAVQVNETSELCGGSQF
ncbi:6-pyruvoyl trahydropterin synthase family protein [Natrialba asiatica]|uniref:6-pyruvoyl-tetrahydropterin synthase n=1 Tax=Natrialba asiatica (strain ATCC 700177 / DSM 12278 / JCM 9576 / FERM P-10747 / NBRC 102637 / 172P1) TaxID=29540 RepID=M0AQ51_NATA1|nr:6-pyruvoyl tetrahydropterin synthase family protein [Natrialba asiatica]ELZ00048.1 6-pyruvoyl-tetrahydropterin synthase [Natrialba asiatica DSM 12278]